MKHKLFSLFTILVSILFTIQSNAQQSWFWQNPLPQGNALLAVSFFDSEIGCVVGDNGTFLKTTDGGANWEYSKIRTENSFYDIVTPASMVYYAIGDSGMFIKSTNGGSHWQKSIIHSKNRLNDIWFWDESKGIIVADSGFIFMTEDGGGTWQTANSPTNHDIIQTYFLDDSVGWILTAYGEYNSESELYITYDGGANWSLIVQPSFGFTAFIFIDELNGFVTNRLGKLMKTTNGGYDWSTIQFSANLLVRKFQIVQNSTIVGISFGGINSDWVVRSTNSGQTWTAISYNLSNPAVYFTNTTKGIAVDSWANIYMSTNLGSSFEIILGDFRGYIDDIEIINENFGMALYGFDKYLLTNNSGLDWQEKSFNFLFYPTKIFFLNEELGWVCGYDQILRTEDSGQNWISYFVGSQDFQDIQFVNENVGFCISSHNIYRSLNGGNTWYSINQFSNYLKSSFFLSPEIGFIGTEDGKIYATTDSGNNWTENFSEDIGPVVQILFVDSITGFGIDRNGLLKTTNGGLEWEYELIDTQYFFNSCDFVDKDYGWITGANGLILKTTDGGNSWDEYVTGTSNYITTVDFINRDMGWIAGANSSIMKTFNGGVSSLGEIENNINQSIINYYYLSQNYPNPFNPSTKIKYSIPVVGPHDRVSVQLKIYDVLGNEIATLVNEEKTRGSYEIEFDGTDLTSGIYFYRLQAGSFVETKKMILLK